MNGANLFGSMADTLERHASVSTVVPGMQPGQSKTDRLRQALAEGPKSAAELAPLIGVRTDLVRALLKNDIDTGRVRKLQGGLVMLYEVVEVDPEATKLTIAIALLEKNGYVVQKGMQPRPKPATMWAQLARGSAT